MEQTLKIENGAEKNFTEAEYRFLTLFDLALDEAVIAKINNTFDKIEDVIENGGSQETPGIIREIMKKIVHGIHTIMIRPFNILDNLVETTEDEFAQILEKNYGVKVNQWAFSKQNVEIYNRIVKLIVESFSDLKEIGALASVKYLLEWTLIQKLFCKGKAIQAGNKRNAVQPGQEQTEDLRQVREELKHFAVIVNGTYGGKNNDDTEQFLAKTKMAKEDLLFTFWEATPYHPAYTICRDQEAKAIVLCVRGSKTWADFVTDMDSQYLKFDVRKENGTNDLYIKFNFDEKSQASLKKLLGETTSPYNKENSHESSEKDEITISGSTHAGMLASAVMLYKETSARIEEFLSQPEHEGYDLVITGHSLGGGMSTLMTLLYTVHPLAVLKGDMKRMKTYTYAAAPVLSNEFDSLMQDKIKTIIFGNDVVPRMSTGSIQDVVKIIKLLDNAEQTQHGLRDLILNYDLGEEFEDIKDKDEEHVKKELNLYKIIRSKLTSLKLHPMGRTFHILPVKGFDKLKNDFDYVIVEVQDKTIFEEIIFARHAIDQHSLSNYQEGLNSDKIYYDPNSQ